MKYDIRDDATKLREYIRERVRGFDAESNDSPGDPSSPISLIHVGFEHEQGGYVAIVFDTRPAAEPDGEWTMHIEDENNVIEFPQWAECTEAIFEDSKLELIDGHGKTHVFTEGNDEGYVEIFGRMIAQEVRAALDVDLFAPLPLASNCRIYIEQINGAYRWPEGEELARVSRI